MKINKAELQAALEKVKPGLSTKEIISQATHFAFMGDRVVTYNDEISVSCLVPNLNLTGAVPANELHNYLGRVQAAEIEMEITEHELQLTAGKSKAGLVLHSEVTLPLEELGQQTGWQKIPDGLVDAIAFCRFSCSRDMSRPVLTCIHVSNNGFVQSCDNYRITKCEFLQTKNPINTFLMPATSAQELIKHDVQNICFSTGWAHFRTVDKAVTFSCRLFDDNYPDTTAVLSMGNPVEIKLPKKLGEMLQRAEVFAKAEFDAGALVDITLADRKMVVSAENASGWFKEESPVRYTGTPITISVNPAFVQDMLSRTAACSIDNTKMQFVGDGWAHVVSLTEKE